MFFECGGFLYENLNVHPIVREPSTMSDVLLKRSSRLIEFRPDMDEHSNNKAALRPTIRLVSN